MGIWEETNESRNEKQEDFKIELLAGLVPSEGGEGEAVSCLWPNFSQPQAFLGLSLERCLLLAPLHGLPWCARLNVQISPFYRDTSHVGLGAHPNGLILTRLPLQRPFFPNTVSF